MRMLFNYPRTKGQWAALPSRGNGLRLWPLAPSGITTWSGVTSQGDWPHPFRKTKVRAGTVLAFTPLYQIARLSRAFVFDQFPLSPREYQKQKKDPFSRFLLFLWFKSSLSQARTSPAAPACPYGLRTRAPPDNKNHCRYIKRIRQRNPAPLYYRLIDRHHGKNYSVL